MSNEFDVNDEAVVDEVEVEQAEEHQFPVASSSFIVAIGEQPVPALKIAAFADGAPAEWFVQAKHPRGDEAKIRDAGVGVTIDYGPAQNRAQRRGKRVAEGQAAAPKGIMRQDPDAHFLAKCRYQITGFALPARKVGSDGSPTLTRFDIKDYGWNQGNIDVYEAVLYAPDQTFRNLLEDYLDWVAGRDLDTQYDFEALGNAQGQ